MCIHPFLVGVSNEIIVRVRDISAVDALPVWVGFMQSVEGLIEQVWNEMKPSHSVVSDSLQPHGLCSSWNSPGQNTGVGSLSLLQGIFPTQRSNPGLPHFWQILYQLSHKGSPRILEQVAYPFSRGSSRPRNRIRVSCTAGISWRPQRWEREKTGTYRQHIRWKLSSFRITPGALLLCLWNAIHLPLHMYPQI